MAVWMNLQVIIVAEISQRKTDTVSSHLYVEPNSKQKQTNKYPNSQKKRLFLWLPEMGEWEIGGKLLKVTTTSYNINKY